MLLCIFFIAVLQAFFQLSQSCDRGVRPVAECLLGSYVQAWGVPVRVRERHACLREEGRRQVCPPRESADVLAQTGLNAIGVCKRTE